MENMDEEVAKSELAQVSVKSGDEEKSNLLHGNKIETVNQGTGPRTYKDPILKAKLEQADKDLQKMCQARSEIIHKLRAKMLYRTQVIDLMKDLDSVNRYKGVGLCLSEEELNNLIKSLQYRIQHGSVPLAKQKLLLEEIKQLEGGIRDNEELANAAKRAKIQPSMDEKEVIQAQVKLLEADLDNTRKVEQVVEATLKQFNDEKKAMDKEIKSLEAEFVAAEENRRNANETCVELKRQLAKEFYENNKHLLIR